MAVSNFDVFEDRTKSLLTRWATFREKHKDEEDIDAKCITACLAEIDDGYTQQLIEGGNVNGRAETEKDLG